MIQVIINIIWSYTRQVLTVPDTILRKTRLNNFVTMSIKINRYTNELNPNLVRVIEFQDGGLHLFYKQFIVYVKVSTQTNSYKFSCYYSTSAKQDIESIINYIKNNNGRDARNFVLNLINTRSRILIPDHPHSWYN